MRILNTKYYLIFILINIAFSGILMNLLNCKCSTSSVPELTTIFVNTDSINIGKIVWGNKRKVVFQIKNKGNYPLIIKDIKTACECTTFSYDKEPLCPNHSKIISVVFEAITLGTFTRTIDIICNIKTERCKLKISGEVLYLR